MTSRPTINAIELAWYSDLTAVQIAQTHGVTKWTVHKIWAQARAQGRILKMRRDQRPAEYTRIFQQLCHGVRAA